MEARLARVRVADCKETAFWARGAAACAFSSCRAQGAGAFGFYVDATHACAFQDCAAERCVDAGFVFYVPTSLLKEHKATLESLNSDLLTTPHSAKVRPLRSCADVLMRCCCRLAAALLRCCALTRIRIAALQGIRSVNNSTYGALISGGASVTLDDAELADNAWNGLRLEHATLACSSARIGLARIRITGNGHGTEASDEHMERCGMVIERSLGGASRRAALEPPWMVDAKPPALPEGVPDECFAGNAGGAWAFCRDRGVAE